MVKTNSIFEDYKNNLTEHWSKTAECTWCDKEFTYRDNEVKEWQDYGYDKYGNDIPRLKGDVVCPHCKKWTTVFEI